MQIFWGEGVLIPESKDRVERERQGSGGRRGEGRGELASEYPNQEVRDLWYVSSNSQHHYIRAASRATDCPICTSATSDLPRGERESPQVKSD